MKHNYKKKAVNASVYIGLSILAVIWILPILWVILTSFRLERGSYVTTFFPKNLTLDNYLLLFTDIGVLNFPRMFMNTLLIASIACVISCFFVLSVAYCTSRLRFKLRKPLMNIAMILGLFPGFMSMIAVYYILQALGLSEGAMIKVALILVYSAASGTGFYVAKGFFDTIPKALDEAALLDGANKWQIFTRITIPLSRPILVYTALSSFLAPWVDFIFARVICRADASQYTVSIGMWRMLEYTMIDAWYTRFAAAAVCVSIPIAILFVVMQKFYAEGMSGAVKG
ncbi:ABC transporter permease subunit [Traorella massiliensis]|uniref:sugar ABC transporter permease n=1 Tax=Traorella massiliensis TaxID=1903263 RepID=UPI0008F93D9C|nr:ABC transporter permease subunit [Traorella massiliensis]